jgi:ERCC4-type nuclease
MTEPPNTSATANQNPQQTSRSPHQTWWDHRFSVSDGSFDEENKPIDKSREEFWIGKEKSDGYLNEVKDTGQTDLTSIGKPPEEFSEVFEVVVRFHDLIQEPLDCEPQFSQDATIESVVEKIPRTGSVIVANLKKEGYGTVGDLHAATRDELMDVHRVGEETADRLLEITPQELNKKSGKSSDVGLISADEKSLRDISMYIPRFGGENRKRLEKAGYKTVSDIRAASREELLKIEQIGEGTVSKLMQYVEEHSAESAATVGHGIADETPIEELVDDVPRVGRVLVSKLNQAGYETVGDLRSATVDELASVDHIGQKKAETLLESVY